MLWLVLFPMGDMLAFKKHLIHVFYSQPIKHFCLYSDQTIYKNIVFGLVGFQSLSSPNQNQNFACAK